MLRRVAAALVASAASTSSASASTARVASDAASRAFADASRDALLARHLAASSSSSFGRRGAETATVASSSLFAFAFARKTTSPIARFIRDHDDDDDVPGADARTASQVPCFGAGAGGSSPALALAGAAADAAALLSPAPIAPTTTTTRARSSDDDVRSGIQTTEVATRDELSVMRRAR